MRDFEIAKKNLRITHYTFYVCSRVRRTLFRRNGSKIITTFTVHCNYILLYIMLQICECQLCGRSCSHDAGWMGEKCANAGFIMIDNCCTNTSDDTVVG